LAAASAPDIHNTMTTKHVYTCVVAARHTSPPSREAAAGMQLQATTCTIQGCTSALPRCADQEPRSSCMLHKIRTQFCCYFNYPSMVMMFFVCSSSDTVIKWHSNNYCEAVRRWSKVRFSSSSSYVSLTFSFPGLANDVMSATGEYAHDCNMCMYINYMYLYMYMNYMYWSQKQRPATTHSTACSTCMWL